MAKTIIIDGQMWQTDAYFRGMGGYAFGLFRAFMAAHDDTRLIVVLNKNMTHDEDRVAGIREWLPSAEIHLLDLPFEPEPGVEESRASTTLDDFVASQTEDSSDVYYFIPALFMFQYCAVFPSKVRKLLLFHDLMPLIYRSDLGKYFPAHLYFPRFKTIFEADVVFTNSQTTANDLMQYLGADQKHIVNIDGSLNDHIAAGQPDASSEEVLDRLQLRDKRFILMPTGGLENKNNVRAVEALTMLNRTLSSPVQLVATSFFSTTAQEELRLFAGDTITFTGNITNEELSSLYAHCSAVMMPSLYEGLGLPVLEGVAHGKPVACSDVPVFQEIPHFKDALYAFNPIDPEDMAEAMLRALAQAGFEQKKKHYPEILNKYSWPRSATLFAEALDEGRYFAGRSTPVKRIAVTCPDPRKNNDVAVFAQRMYGYGLQHGVEFVYFIDPGGDDEIGATILPDYIRGMARCYDIGEIYKKAAPDTFAGVVHFLSSDVRFAQLLRASLSIPGCVYVGNEGYYDTIQRMAQNAFISRSQATVEEKLHAQALEEQLFETPSVLGAAKAVIVERHVVQKVRRTLETLAKEVPVLEVTECQAINAGTDALAKQDETYGQVIEFIVKQAV